MDAHYHESDEGYIVHMHIPRLDEDSLKIEVSGNIVRVSGSNMVDFKSESEGFIAEEHSESKFSQELSLPTEVSEVIESHLKEGTLSIKLIKN